MDRTFKAGAEMAIKAIIIARRILGFISNMI